jgi:hypothetical protein
MEVALKASAARFWDTHSRGKQGIRFMPADAVPG